MEFNFDFVQILGFLGVFLNLMIYQQKTPTRVRVNKIVANGVWAIHYFFLDAFTATGIAIVGMISTAVFMKVDPKSRMGKACLGFFIAGNLVIGNGGKNPHEAYIVVDSGENIKCFIKLFFAFFRIFFEHLIARL